MWRRSTPPPVTIRAALKQDCLDLVQRSVWVDELQQCTQLKPETAVTLVAVTTARGVVGYISVTPPGTPTSIDRHCGRGITPPGAYEIRALTVLPKNRGQGIAGALMLAALRYVEVDGGKDIVILARAALWNMYEGLGFVDSNNPVAVGGVQYKAARASVESIRERIGSKPLRSNIRWELPYDLKRMTACFHGGTQSLQCLVPPQDAISADVLDAWYPPSPDVIASITGSLATSVRTTPPSGAPELTRAIAEARGVDPKNILVGPGSSDLMYRCFLHWLTPQSRVLLLDPTYGEYEHILCRVVGCTVDRVQLRAPTFDLKYTDIVTEAAYDLVVIVNPNSPTGRWADLTTMLPWVNARKIWIDETYIDFTDKKSVETWGENVIVCKSMSKVYALSGVRLAYLCASPMLLDAIRARTPPWNVSRLAQLAGVAALRSKDYYAAKIEETHRLRQRMVDALHDLGAVCVPGCANFIMFSVDDPTEFVARCARSGVFVRTVDTPSGKFVRTAVKGAAQSAVMIDVFAAAYMVKRYVHVLGSVKERMCTS